MWVRRTYLKLAILMVSTYILITAALFFGFNHPTADQYLNETDPSRFWSEEYCGDQVVLIEDWDDALKVRLDWISKAQSSIDVSYHSLHNGIIADVFLAALFEAADRGVQVRILMDGIFHGLYLTKYDVRYALQFHPYIEYRLYEPLDILRPWTWNNRLHDKIMIVDNKVALISGRNVGNRYYMPAKAGKDTVFDRDVVVYNLGTELSQESGVTQMANYFQSLWEHPYTKAQVASQTAGRTKRAAAQRERLTLQLTSARKDYPDYFADSSQWLRERSIPVKQVTLIHNPIQRGNKEPWLWSELVRLAEQAQTSIIIQSPFVVPTNAMLKHIDPQIINNKDIVLVTNSLAASPNVLAIAGYKNKRPQLKQWVKEIWEYSGPGSLHGKSLVIDDDISIIGSFNIDARSTFLSTETMLVIHSKEFNHQLRQVIYEQIAASQPVKESPPVAWYKSFTVSVLQFLSKPFDYLL